MPDFCCLSLLPFAPWYNSQKHGGFQQKLPDIRGGEGIAGGDRSPFPFNRSLHRRWSCSWIGSMQQDEYRTMHCTGLHSDQGRARVGDGRGGEGAGDGKCCRI